jgi:hypothetical protein
MRWRSLGLAVPAALIFLITGCSSESTASVADGTPPDSVYLDAVCGSGQERRVFVLLAQGYQERQGIPPEQVLEAARTALTATERAVEMLRAPNVTWPASIAADVQTVASNEETRVRELQSLTGADPADLDSALQVYFDSPDSDPGAGERVRSELGLGKPGDCPTSPASERAFIALVQRFAPTIYERGDEAVLALGRETCSIIGLNLPLDEQTTQVKALGLTDVQAGVVVEAASGYVCEVSTESQGTADEILDLLIAGTLILTQRQPATQAEEIVQFQDAQAEWARAADILGAGVPGVPSEVTEVILGELEKVLDSMSEVISCFQTSQSASCSTETSELNRLTNILGQEAAALIPYGSRTADEVIAAFEGRAGSPSTSSDITAGGGAPESVSQSNAVQKAADYLSFAAFSRQGLIDQLKYEGFSEADATYGADAVGADWNEQAALKAQEYLDFTAFSRTGLIEQLQFEGFTVAEATYGANAVGL